VKKWLQLERPDVPLDELPEEPIVLAPPAPPPGAIKRARIRQAQALAQQGMSYSEIARQIGAHRVTISKWVHQELPPEAEVSPVAPTRELSPPPAPWQSWEQVRQIRELLQKHRFVLLKRPEKLNEAEQAHLSALLDSPVGAELRVGRDFLVDWYRIWQDEKGQRRSPSEAQTRYEAWQTEETYGAVPVLQRLQQRMTAAKFEQMSQFLRQPEWEATNNGAERAGRAFRHRQAPHFNLRSKEAIIGAINVAAYLRIEAVTAPREEPFHTCQRGRTQRIELAIPIEVSRPAYAA
jgi:transposase